MNLSKQLTLTIFLIISSQLCQAQRAGYHYLFPQYKCSSTCLITDALFTINGDTIPMYSINQYKGGYEIPVKYFIDTKAHVKIKHRDFPTVILDSVLLDERDIYMLKKDEIFYTSNGLKIPLNHGQKLLAIKFWNYGVNIPKKGKAIIDSICNKYNFSIARNFKAEIMQQIMVYGESTAENMNGCLNQELSYTYWLKRDDSSDFANENPLFSELRNLKNVEWVGLPQDSYEIVSNNIYIEFRKGVNENEVNRIIEKYDLKNKIFYKAKRSDYEEYNFTVPYLIPPNELMNNLMKEPLILKAWNPRIIYAQCT